MFGEIQERPNGKFLGSFYWVHPYGLADYEEEWGRKWIDGIDYEFAIRHPFYDKTGNTRPFGDIEELNFRKLKVADMKSDDTWHSVGYKIQKLIFDVALDSSKTVSINIKELAELLVYLDEDEA